MADHGRNVHRFGDETSREFATRIRKIPLLDDAEKAIAARDAEIAEEAAKDAARYRRLRVLGCAPMLSKNLDEGTVLCFTNLDAFVDEDLRTHPSRGEPRP